LKKRSKKLLFFRGIYDAGMGSIVPPVQELKVFWFFSSEKNILPHWGPASCGGATGLPMPCACAMRANTQAAGVAPPFPFRADRNPQKGGR
jgi:hypothetical protein